ncbi:FKBP-type peptidyl-prolyl cis-trans isomerase [Nocardioides caeni]|uniref:Peptidyl-prolyl cis-trans isomerase n=1 Tax=Nocardioides caeni TaxID=574700 RepID=A0A4S8NM58_9ACTN|nr:FKBP-type peptidyl-prolyl cis-trans isomerase [Nocardioides caeni]THV17938.1 FKBP-type peptidyl-prolyl cis-trans isomerase [Nocardioides caeni]
MRIPTRLTAAVVVPVALLGLAACGESDDEGQATDDSSASESVDPDADADTDAGSTDDDLTSGAEAMRECTAPDIEVLGGFGTKPRVVIPDDCLPPEELLVKDLVKGTGPEAELGGTVEANYLLVTWSDKVALDNSFDRGMTFPVSPLGQAQVIQGWNEGLLGMQQGTRRLLVVPPDLGYGQGGNGIAPNETLVFVVDAVSVS